MKRVFLFLMLLCGGNPPCDCDVPCETMELIDISETNPVGIIDDKVWLKMSCGLEKAPTPFDWQLAELSGNDGSVFAWPSNPRIAYITGEAGTYQAEVLAKTNSATRVITLPHMSK